jgi:MoxR-like ATPase
MLVREGKNLRGIAGAWKITETKPALTGKAVGQPVSIPTTPSDYRDLQWPIVPTTLVQKLVRTVKDENSVSGVPFKDQFDDVYDKATTSPTNLVVYTKAVSSPVIQVVQPIRVPNVVAPYLPQEQVATPVVTEEVEVPPTAEVIAYAETLQESEPLMEFSSTLAPSRSDAEAVLTVPDAELYVPRVFDGLKEQEILSYAQANQYNVLYTGDAGTGKTSSARNYAAVNGLPFVVIECTQQIDQSITQGRFVPTGQGNTMKWKYSQLATAIQRPSVILINELTRMTPKAASLFLRLLMERELVIESLNEVIKVHPECIFIADQNTGLGYTGTSRQDAALVDRFNIKLEFHYDSEIEAKFIKSPTLLQFASNIREAAELNDEFSVPMSTRILKNFQAQAVGLNFEFAVNSMLSNYPKMDGERDAIKMRFDADAQQIADELGISLGKYSTR